MFWRAWRQHRIRRRPFPSAWTATLRRDFPRYGRLAPDDRARLDQLIQIFLAEKRFEGAGGLKIVEEIKIVIAAQACLLLLHRACPLFPGLHSVIVYPGDYVARHRARDEIGVVREGLQVRQGETAARGAVVVSWAAARLGAAGPNDSRNVVLHEFAHLLDAERGGFDGAPRLAPADAESWSRVLACEYRVLSAQVDAGLGTPLDPYAASSPAEFFAVATERFFQDPSGLSRDLPVLFAELSRFYRQDPRLWDPAGPGDGTETSRRENGASE